MVIRFYRILSDILLIPIFFYFFMRFLFSKENKNSISDKFFLKKKKRPLGDLIWINGVSIGEAKTGVTIAEQIKKIYPNSIILFSTSTVTSFKLISKLKKDFILIYSPLDINFITRKFIKYWKPSSTIFIESEIWPNIFQNLKLNSIKLTLFNARISNKSFINWSKIKKSSKKVFQLIDNCFVQDTESLKRFKKLGATKVQKIENLKFLSSQLEFDKQTYDSVRKQVRGKRVITLFSSHEGEEKLLLECFLILSKKVKNIFFIIIPRHTHRIKEIAKELKKRGLGYQLKSNKNIKLNKSNFLIVNTFGELGLFFKLSEIALVGGSFLNFGGHNPIETNGFECPLIFGKYMENFKEIKDQILKNKAGFEVKDLKQLENQIYKILMNKKLKIQTFNNFKKLCDKESAKSKSILKRLLK